MVLLLRWILVLLLAVLAGKLVSKMKLPSILGWLLVGMFLGPHALGLMPQAVLDTQWYKTAIMWMQCAFGLMLGTELVWKNLGLTLLPHSGVSLVFTGIACSALASQPELVSIVQGTIAAAAVIKRGNCCDCCQKGL